ncbi:uncharacterized protein GGS22DRAFT_157003 [Annulohypoxylon maeteangense]|uniref:uncharacterized protein n=1 Tax=Annulohypoxylon maeteangense TaxID=1927788 RepID=UPI002008DECC|nr:uncharacterized protein GGS22DRAFT_157003 [Annulohypoxylon maeteangense]KAI0887388.1 hypothetical protein GGS22DRAFT_157003 [Annulohypoxylon maeteangense]
MASLRLLLPILGCLALTIAATSLLTYVPECAQDCVTKSLNGTCAGPEDSQCLCNNMRTIGIGSVSCASAACGNSTEQVATELRSGYVKYCSAADVSVAPSATAIPSFGWGAGGFGGGSWGSSVTVTVASTATGMSTATTSSTTLAPTGEAENSPNAPASGGGSHSGLSGGAIAGIAVGGVIGVISITGGLLLFAFRLGRNHSQRKKEEAEAETGGQQESGSGNGGPKPDSPANNTAEADKVQLEGKPLSELPTEYTLSGFERIRELPTQERPAELCANALPRYADIETPILPRALSR